MKLIRTEDAVGHVLCHDMTRIVRGVTKGAAFRKGHVVQPEDIPVLLSMGKENLYVWEKEEGMVHENDGALRLCALCQNTGMSQSEVKEGKIELTAQYDGLFVVDQQRLTKVNSCGEVMIATRHSGTPVKAGDKLAGMRVIPLVIKEEKLQQAESAAGDTPLLQLLPFTPKTAGIVVTGSEVFKGRIKDTFSPVVEEKLARYGITTTHKVVVDDGIDAVTQGISQMQAAGVDVILCTGGMSVDPDDKTPGAIKASGAQIVTYGAPVLPGAMFLLGYMAGGTVIMGLPGCVMYAAVTVFDLILPKIAADQKVTAEEIAALGCGGLCLGCDVCTYPNCGFGKGV